MWRYPHVGYEQQIEMILADLKRSFVWTKMEDEKEVEETFTLFERITTVRGDSTGIGDFPMEFIRDHSGLPMSDESQVQFTMLTNNEMFTTLDAAIFREPGDPLRTRAEIN